MFVYKSCVSKLSRVTFFASVMVSTVFFLSSCGKIPEGPMAYRYSSVSLARFTKALQGSIQSLGFDTVFVTKSGDLYILQDKDRVNPSQASFTLRETPEGLVVSLNASQFIYGNGSLPVSAMPKFLQLVEKTNQELGVNPVLLDEAKK
jgi:hypothetical protein